MCAATGGICTALEKRERCEPNIQPAACPCIDGGGMPGESELCSRCGREGAEQRHGRILAGCCEITGQGRWLEQGGRRAEPWTGTVQRERGLGEKEWQKQARQNRDSGSGATGISGRHQAVRRRNPGTSSRLLFLPHCSSHGLLAPEGLLDSLENLLPAAGVTTPLGEVA